MVGVSCAIWGHDAEGTHLWHDRHIEAPISFRYNKPNPAIGEKAVELDHTEVSRMRLWRVGRSDQSRLEHSYGTTGEERGFKSATRLSLGSALVSPPDKDPGRGRISAQTKPYRCRAGRARWSSRIATPSRSRWGRRAPLTALAAACNKLGFPAGGRSLYSRPRHRLAGSGVDRRRSARGLRKGFELAGEIGPGEAGAEPGEFRPPTVIAVSQDDPMDKKRSRFVPGAAFFEGCLESRVVLSAIGSADAAAVSSQSARPVPTNTSLTIRAGTLAQPVTFTATVRAADAAAGSPTGMVDIRLDGQVIATLPLSPTATAGKYAVSESTGTFAATPGGPAFYFGNHKLTAVFVPNGEFATTPPTRPSPHDSPDTSRCPVA